MQTDRVVAPSHVLATNEHVRHRPLARPVVQSRLQSASVRFDFMQKARTVSKDFECGVDARSQTS